MPCINLELIVVLKKQSKSFLSVKPFFQVVQFLLLNKVEIHKKDIYGRTPREIGMMLHKSEILNMLTHGSK